MDVLTGPEILKEGDRHRVALASMDRIMKDKDTIKPQYVVVAHNHMVKTARLTYLTGLLERPCADCAHGRGEHASSGKCWVKGCKCDEWLVVDDA